MPQLIKVIEFAKEAVVSRQYIYKAAKLGKIDIVKGKIDLTSDKTIAYLQSVKPAGEPKNGNGNARVISEKSKLEEAKLAKQNRELDLKYTKARNELLERKDVRMVFNKLYAIDVSKLHGLGYTLTPDLAVIFKSTDNEEMIKATELIDQTIYATLEEIKKTMNEFLLSVQGEEIG